MKNINNMNINKDNSKINNEINSEVNSYLCYKGYAIYKSSISLKDQIYIRNELTMKPFVQNSLAQIHTFPIYLESEKKLYVPRFWGINNFGIPSSVKIKEGKNINLTFNGKLRDYQNNIINSYLNQIGFNESESFNKGKGGSLIEIGCGRGKTVMALNIISILKKMTAVIVHKTFLMDQWIERINEFLPGAKIGTIQGQIIDIKNKDIVLIMLQSISQKEYPEELFYDFGFLICDECHHLSGEVFSKALQKLNTKYLLGLSATMNRKDGLTKLFKMYLGEICFKDHEKKEDNVLVKTIKYEVDDEEFEKEETDYRGNIQYSSMISKISNYNNRSELILSILKLELMINPEQQFIILAHTRALLNYLYKGINYQNIGTTGFYVGGMKKDELKNSENKQIILATYQMAAEGLDIKTLTSLIFATPKTDIIQSVGRILRVKHNQPLIIDIQDNHNIFKNQYNKRRKYYVSNNYKIIKTTSEKYLKFIDKNIKYKDVKNLQENNYIDKYDKIWELNNDPNEKKIKLKKNSINIPNYLKISDDLCNDSNELNIKQKKCLINLD
jgi:superfamily II DNA or RNA helicase